MQNPRKDLEEKIMFAFYGVFGASIGFLIFAIVLGGWRFVFTGGATKSWNGLVALIICSGLGCGWGLLSYKFKHLELGTGPSSFFENQAEAILFTKRLMAIGTCLAGLYFIWELAQDLR